MILDTYKCTKRLVLRYNLNPKPYPKPPWSCRSVCDLISCVHVYVCVCIYVFMYVSVYARTYVCVCV